MNYFELFEIPINLTIEKNKLKKQYFVLSRKYHPDMYVNSPKKEQEKILILYSNVNEAYKVLKNKMTRIKYILELSEISSQNKMQLDPMFLMEMMELNEQLDELNKTFNPKSFDSIKTNIEKLELGHQSKFDFINKNEVIQLDDFETLNILKGFYLKMNYILPIKEKLLTFAIQ